MTKYRQSNRPRVKHHICQPEVRPEKNNPYAYCKLCGRAMSNFPVKKLQALAELAKTELTIDHKNPLGIKD